MRISHEYSTLFQRKKNFLGSAYSIQSHINGSRAMKWRSCAVAHRSHAMQSISCMSQESAKSRTLEKIRTYFRRCATYLLQR